MRWPTCRAAVRTCPARMKKPRKSEFELIKDNPIRGTLHFLILGDQASDQVQQATLRRPYHRVPVAKPDQERRGRVILRPRPLPVRACGKRLPKPVHVEPAEAGATRGIRHTKCLFRQASAPRRFSRRSDCRPCRGIDRDSNPHQHCTEIRPAGTLGKPDRLSNPHHRNR